MHIGARERLLDILLFERDAYVDAQNREGLTALMSAARHGQVSFVWRLLQAKASADLVCNAGVTALDMAEINRHVGVAEMLRLHPEVGSASPEPAKAESGSDDEAQGDSDTTWPWSISDGGELLDDAGDTVPKAKIIAYLCESAEPCFLEDHKLGGGDEAIKKRVQKKKLNREELIQTYKVFIALPRPSPAVVEGTKNEIVEWL